MAGVAALVASFVLAPPAAAETVDDRPAREPGVVVALGDSLAAGTGGRWAGNTNLSPSRVDALGSSAYEDQSCLRSTAAAVSEREPIGFGDLPGVNLACAGASVDDLSGQLVELQRLIDEGNEIELVVISVGAEDFGYSSVVTTCAASYIASSSGLSRTCSELDFVTENFAEEKIDSVAEDVANSLDDLTDLLAQTGQDSDVLILTYPATLPADGLRHADGGVGRTFDGGCPFWDADAAFLMDTAVAAVNTAVRDAASATEATLVDLEAAVAGRELCAPGVDTVEGAEVATWTHPLAVDQTEWVHEVSLVDAAEALVRESLQLNYWGQRAVRSCLRQAWNEGGQAQSGSCVRADEGTESGEPIMTLLAEDAPEAGAMAGDVRDEEAPAQ